MHYLNNFSLIIVTIILMASCSLEEVTDMDTIEINNYSLDIEDQIFTYINKYRQTKGMLKLVKNNTAQNLSVSHTQHMIKTDLTNHDDFKKRLKILTEKEKARRVAENVASGYKDAQGVVQGWLNSPEHKKNIEGDFTHTGIAVIKNNEDKYFYTQIFYK